MADNTETKTCPNCASEIGEAAKTCPHCHYLFTLRMTRTRAWIIAALVVLLIVAAVMYRRRLDDAGREGKACADRTVYALTHNLPDPHCI